MTGMQQSRAPAASGLVDRIAAVPAVARALSWAEHQEHAFADETAHIAAIPAPNFGEQERAAYTAARFRDLGLSAVEIDQAGNVYGLIPGAGRAAVAFLAHMDTVFAADVSHHVTRKQGRMFGPGVGDNAAGLAGMIGAVAALNAGGAAPSRPVWFVATVGEEGLGNLRGASAAADRLGGDVDAMIAVEGSFFGRLSHTGVGSRRLEVTCRAPGGHSWHDFGKPSAVHVIARIASAITDLSVPTEPRTTYNIGRIDGGIGVNVIAEEARLLLDMRSISAPALDDLTARARAAISDAAGHGAACEVREVGFRPAGALDPEHNLAMVCAAVLRRLHVMPQYAPASTDANVPLSRGIPAVTLGVTRGGGAHTRAEWIETAPLVRGVQQLVLVTMALAHG